MLIVVALFASFVTISDVYALSDGSYQVGRITSYANPDTGLTVDGGTNTALGDSMCASIVDSKVKLEVSNGKYYVTVGFGLMSSVQNVRFTIYENGSYNSISYKLTDTTIKNNDNCNWYRFEVKDTDVIISPILYITPMGRDVQFFIKLDLTSMTTWSDSDASEKETEKATVEVEKTTTAVKDNETVSANTQNNSNNSDTNDQNTSSGTGSSNSSSSVSDSNTLSETVIDDSNESESVLNESETGSGTEYEDTDGETEDDNTETDVFSDNEELANEMDYFDGVSGLSYHLVNQDTATTDEDDTAFSWKPVIIVCVVFLIIAGAGVAYYVVKKRRDGGNAGE